MRMWKNDGTAQAVSKTGVYFICTRGQYHSQAWFSGAAEDSEKNWLPSYCYHHHHQPGASEASTLTQHVCHCNCKRVAQGRTS